MANGGKPSFEKWDKKMGLNINDFGGTNCKMDHRNGGTPCMFFGASAKDCDGNCDSSDTSVNYEGELPRHKDFFIATEELAVANFDGHSIDDEGFDMAEVKEYGE